MYKHCMLLHVEYFQTNLDSWQSQTCNFLFYRMFLSPDLLQHRLHVQMDWGVVRAAWSQLKTKIIPCNQYLSEDLYNNYSEDVSFIDNRCIFYLSGGTHCTNAYTFCKGSFHLSFKKICWRRFRNTKCMVDIWCRITWQQKSHFYYTAREYNPLK